jgi:tetratricopeptide (TPR) repeat protein
MRALLAQDDDERVQLETRVIELAGDDPFARHAVESLGLVALQRGELDAARGYFERVLEIGERSGDRHHVAGALILLAAVAAEQGQYHEAARELRAGTLEASAIGDKTPFVWERAWAVAATVLAARGSVAEASRILGAAERLREDDGAPLAGFTEAFHKMAVARIRAVTTVEEFDRAWQEGRRLSSYEYLDEMLRRLD